jgi:hypothetical protein
VLKRHNFIPIKNPALVPGFLLLEEVRVRLLRLLLGVSVTGIDRLAFVMRAQNIVFAIGRRICTNSAKWHYLGAISLCVGSVCGTRSKRRCSRKAQK